MSGTTPTDRTLAELTAKLAEFRASPARLGLLYPPGTTLSNWAKELEREHARAVQAPPPESAFVRAGLRSRLLVLDASFNPPTLAHAHMAKLAVRDVLAEQRAALAGASAAPVVRPQTRLVLLLAVANADKPAAPAPLEHRLAMIYAFARRLQEELRGQGDEVPVDMALTSEPFFSGKADALRAASWYPGAELLPMEFIVGFDTLVRILDPKYYKGEASQTGEGAAGSGHQEKGGVEAAARGRRPQTPMMRALDPFFTHASLRVMLRPGEDYGGRDAQRSYIAALGGAAQGDATGSSLDEVGGDASWMRKVHVLSDEETGGTVAEGVSSSRVRQLVHDGGPPAAQDLVHSPVLDWISRYELYRRSRLPKGTSTDDGGSG
ncbi:cytidylyltransferase [Cordyceps fumosorosea ARSEF 2679]|uniref:Cytidylyltransferase n=1 Tax=Cordyceps fumosorosea (strain ARSEF 2679) TaxID=1081104 RepID=A0A168B9L3_CORFA|nr:cytidylyltransferase [Cordyceps fumosorosea ARSEF 2679]OAA69813.1 cytidylyltransferase [Cordyceps fumosorosea ARSEF 2679]